MTGRLEGRRVVLTRPAESGAAWKESLEREGAAVVEIPVVAVSPPSDWAPLDGRLPKLGEYGLFLFTSANAVRSFFGRLGERNAAFPASGRSVAAVGAKTAEALRERGVDADLVPERSGGAEELGDLLRRRLELKRLRVLFPKAERAREHLPEFLSKHGAAVDAVTVYRTSTNRAARADVRRLLRERADLLTFASGSAVHAFFELAGREKGRLWIRSRGVRVVSLGKSSSEALNLHGLRADREAASPTLEALVEAAAGVR